MTDEVRIQARNTHRCAAVTIRRNSRSRSPKYPPRGSHTPKIDYPPVKMLQFAGDACSAGIEEVERDQVKLRVGY